MKNTKKKPSDRTLKKKAAQWNETYRQYPARANRYVEVIGAELVGGLSQMTYQALPCGCKVKGNGSLQFPLTVAQCSMHWACKK